MKKLFTFAVLSALLLTITNNANAKIRRVGYWGLTVANIDYPNLQAAHDAAAAGDTILIFPGTYAANYSKTLVTLGYGYFVDTASLKTQANAALQNITGALNISIFMYSGANNCVFEGLDGLTLSSASSGTTSTISGVVVRRCKGNIGLTYNVNTNWQILQCFINTLSLTNGTNGASISNLTVNNCYIYAVNGSNGTSANQTGEFTNNVTDYYMGFNNGAFIVKNNIFLSAHSADANVVYQNCIFNSSYNPVSGNGNKIIDNTTMVNNVFVGWTTQGTYSNDARFQLKAGSPAIGAGMGGTDCGMFGGTNPYKLSGIPRIPSIYKLTAPSNLTSTNPYTVTFSVRSNN